MSVNLMNVLEDMHTVTKKSYEEYPDGTFCSRMPTLDDLDLDDEADRAYENWKTTIDTNKEDI